tara:strand:- start:206 stop:889 length:684 start_codon:yes stop_codon:yes gene_type:complete
VNIKGVKIEDLRLWGLEKAIKRQIIIDRLLEREDNLQASVEEINNCYFRFMDINTQDELQLWMKREGLDKEITLKMAERHYRWLKSCEKKYKNQVATSFLKNKAKLDKVSYSMIWIKDEALANEIFVRIKESECSVDDAIIMSTDPPRGLKIGRLGPIRLKDLPDALAEILRISQDGQLWPPIKVETGWAIVKHDKTWPAVFNKEEKENILLELGDKWIEEEIESGE